MELSSTLGTNACCTSLSHINVQKRSFTHTHWSWLWFPEQSYSCAFFLFYFFFLLTNRSSNSLSRFRMSSLCAWFRDARSLRLFILVKAQWGLSRVQTRSLICQKNTKTPTMWHLQGYRGGEKHSFTFFLLSQQWWRRWTGQMCSQSDILFLSSSLFKQLLWWHVAADGSEVGRWLEKHKIYKLTSEIHVGGWLPAPPDPPPHWAKTKRSKSVEREIEAPNHTRKRWPFLFSLPCRGHEMHWNEDFCVFPVMTTGCSEPGGWVEKRQGNYSAA